MPFKIIRNDITRVKADAIVNTANPEPLFASGTDAAIYKAAGADGLLAERKKIGRIAPGEVAATIAFALPAKYIIHTVEPAWAGGNHGEYDILRSCYRKSLLLADQLGCESIAFPLIATGVCGFPKDRALEIALSVIREHLEDSDLDVTLVVSGRSSYQIASGLVERIDAFIDENYVAERTAEESGGAFKGLSESRRRRKHWKRGTYLGSVHLDTLPSDAMASSMADLTEEDRGEDVSYAPVAEVALPSPAPKPEKTSLEDAIGNLGESFQERLLRMIGERGMTDPEVYKRANVDRKLFSKIRCSEDYIPKKKTIVALAIALRLSLDEAKDLLASAGLMLTNNSKADVIVRFCLENEIYDIFEVNALLFKYHQPILG
ncbi:MAG: macro domain-containing protein [Sphaerochaetaceae bacterium]|nr:macro domain-containing protein [Spirochaetales bacterium]MDY5498892.1 macro domain-containing protein [Sphaerochaetaceae bacterium]